MSQSQGKVRKAIANGRLGGAATSERCSGRACTGLRRAASSPWAARRLGCRGRVERLHPRGSARSSGPRARITPDTARPLGFSHRDGHAARPPLGLTHRLPWATEHLFMRPPAIRMSAWGTCLFKAFTQFLNWVVCFLTVEFREASMYFNSSPSDENARSNCLPGG